MSPMVRLIGGGAALLVILVAVGFALPRSVTVSRAVVINAPESEVFGYVNAPKRFNEWSPWAEYDPDATYSYSGPESGKGARMEWEGASIGSGSQEITGSDPNRRVDVALSFEGEDATAHYLLAPSGAGTRLTWQFQSELGVNPFERWMGVLYDRWIGADYEKGLRKLRNLAEGRPPAQQGGLR